MSIESLFNKKCSWKRKVFGQVDQFNQPIYTETIIASDQDCAFQEITGDLREVEPVEVNRKIFDWFLATGQDVRPEDIVVIDGSENFKVHSIDNAAGRDHHLRARVEQTIEVTQDIEKAQEVFPDIPEVDF